MRLHERRIRWSARSARRDVQGDPQILLAREVRREIGRQRNDMHWEAHLMLSGLALLLLGHVPVAAGSLSWEQIGPDLEVNVVAVAPATGDTILTSSFLVSTPQAYRTDDGGASWSPIPGLAGIYDIVVDPRRPAFMYAVGGVVSVSRDGGVTWEPRTAGIGATVITLDPANGRRLYVGARCGGETPGSVFRSDDWGSTWSDIGVNLPPVGFWDDVADIVVDPTDSSTIFVSTYRYDGGTGVYKTEDSGATWEWLGWPGEEGVPPGPMSNVSRMHISAVDPQRLIAGSGNCGGGGVTGAIYETADGGATWNTLCVSGVPDIAYLKTEALEPLSLRHDTVFLGADNGGGPDKLFYSLDSGRGWRPLVDEVLDDTAYGPDIATDDSMRVYYTTNSGIVRSSVPRGPSIVYAGCVVDDSAGGNGNGQVDPGEAVSLDVELRNLFARASAVSATLSSDDVFVSVTQQSSAYPDLVWGESATSLTPFEFQVEPARPPGPLEFTLKIVATGFSASEAFFVEPKILLVDDDDFGPYETAYEQALEENHLAYRTWHVVPDGAVTADLLAGQSAVAWFTSGVQPGVRGTTLSPEEEDLLSSYLDGGGRLFLSSQDYLSEAPSGVSDFATRYLHVGGCFKDTHKPGVGGLPGDPIGDGLTFNPLEYPFGNRSDSVFPDGLAAKVMNGVPGTAGAAIRYPAEGDTFAFRTVFFAFPFEAVPEGGEPPCTRATLMRRVVKWLVPEGGLVPTGVADQPQAAPTADGPRLLCSPNPARGAVRLDITSPGERGDVRVTIYSIDGRRVWGPCVAGMTSEGTASVTWDGCSEAGTRAASGVYLVRASAGGRSTYGKVVLIE
jgi:photosystem II stability/assembly factor-like uncharacterized protein